jgi:hypothetical protein
MYFFENTSLPPSLRVKILKGEREKEGIPWKREEEKGKIA